MTQNKANFVQKEARGRVSLSVFVGLDRVAKHVRKRFWFQSHCAVIVAIRQWCLVVKLNGIFPLAVTILISIKQMACAR